MFTIRTTRCAAILLTIWPAAWLNWSACWAGLPLTESQEWLRGRIQRGLLQCVGLCWQTSCSRRGQKTHPERTTLPATQPHNTRANLARPADSSAALSTMPGLNIDLAEIEWGVSRWTWSIRISRYPLQLWIHGQTDTVRYWLLGSWTPVWISFFWTCTLSAVFS